MGFIIGKWYRWTDYRLDWRKESVNMCMKSGKLVKIFTNDDGEKYGIFVDRQGVPWTISLESDLLEENKKGKGEQ